MSQRVTPTNNQTGVHGNAENRAADITPGVQDWSAFAVEQDAVMHPFFESDHAAMVLVKDLMSLVTDLALPECVVTQVFTEMPPEIFLKHVPYLDAQYFFIGGVFYAVVSPSTFSDCEFKRIIGPRHILIRATYALSDAIVLAILLYVNPKICFRQRTGVSPSRHKRNMLRMARHIFGPDISPTPPPAPHVPTPPVVAEPQAGPGQKSNPQPADSTANDAETGTVRETNPAEEDQVLQQEHHVVVRDEDTARPASIGTVQCTSVAVIPPTNCCGRNGTVRHDPTERPNGIFLDGVLPPNADDDIWSDILPETRRRLIETFQHNHPMRSPFPQDNGPIITPSDVESDPVTPPIFSDVARRQLPVHKLGHHFNPVFGKLNFRGSIQRVSELPFGVVYPEKLPNAHATTSYLKHYLAQWVHSGDFDVYALSGQEWLDHPGNGPALLALALDTTVINNDWATIERLDVPLIAVVEDYTEGKHIDREYRYDCQDGHVLGYSNGKRTQWYDENLFSSLAEGEIKPGWFIHTIFRFGPQRLIVINRLPSSTTAENQPRLAQTRVTDHRIQARQKASTLASHRVERNLPPPVYPTKYQAAQFKRVPKMWTYSLRPAFYLTALLGLIGFYYTRQFPACLIIAITTAVVLLGALSIWSNPLAHKWPCVRGTLWAWFLDFQPQPAPFTDLCPRYQVQGKHAEDFANYLRSANIVNDGNIALPPGFYYVDEVSIIRLPPCHPDVNYTNVHLLAQQYAASRSWSITADIRVLTDFFGPIAPYLVKRVSDSIIIDTPPPVDPFLEKTIPIKASVETQDNKFRIARLDSEHTDFTFAEPSADAVALAASTRVLQWTQEADFELALQRLAGFWNTVVNGGNILQDPSPPDFACYSGAKRRLYERTFCRMTTRAKAFYSSFLKIECLPSLNLLNGKATRLIQANSKKFNITVFNFFHEFEKRLLASEDQYGLPLFAKGMNFDNRWEIIQLKRMQHRYVASCDFSNFDGHNKGQGYLAEIAFYNSIGLDIIDTKALRTAQTSGVLSHDKPMRHSGDLFTGSGNCLQAASILYWKGATHTIYCDGDDTLIFYDDKKVLDDLVQRAAVSGHQLTFDTVSDEEIPFCQHKFTPDGYHPDLDRVYNKLFNIPYTSLQDLVNRTYGKLCALQMYVSMGVSDLTVPWLPPTEESAALYLDRYSGYTTPPTASTPSAKPSGPIIRLLDFIDKCQHPTTLYLHSLKQGATRFTPQDVDKLLGDRNVADASQRRAVKRAIREFFQQEMSFSACDTQRLGQQLTERVCTHTLSEAWVLRHGFPEFQSCTSQSESIKSGSKLSAGTALSPTVYSLSATTPTPTTRHQLPKQPCFPSTAANKSRYPKVPKSFSQAPCSQRHQVTGSPKAPARSSSTFTSGPHSGKVQQVTSQLLPTTTSPSRPHNSQPVSAFPNPSSDNIKIGGTSGDQSIPTPLISVETCKSPSHLDQPPCYASLRFPLQDQQPQKPFPGISTSLASLK